MLVFQHKDNIPSNTHTYIHLYRLKFDKVYVYIYKIYLCKHMQHLLAGNFILDV